LEEVAERVNFLLREGSNPHRKCHFGLVDVEAKERAANPKGHKRLIKELSSAEEYGEWNAEFDRFYEQAGNPVIARSIMLRAWKQLSNELIQRLAKDEGGADGRTSE
jgi:hypothetical protein